MRICTISLVHISVLTFYNIFHLSIYIKAPDFCKQNIYQAPFKEAALFLTAGVCASFNY